MKPRSLITMILGIILAVLGMVMFVISRSAVGAIPLLIGGSLYYLGLCGGRTATLVFGHTTIVIGCAMIAWGIYLLPYSKPTFSHVFAGALLWGLFSLFAGTCANLHGFCQCIRRQKSVFLSSDRDATSTRMS